MNCSSIITAYDALTKSIEDKNVDLIVVSKRQLLSSIQCLYDNGHRRFAENRVQDLIEKKEALPDDIHWHMIGHLQSNKVKYILPFIELIHSVDTIKLLKAINKEAIKINRTIPILLQIKIADESTKSGFDFKELKHFLIENELTNFPGIDVQGVMGMATFTDNLDQVASEFGQLKSYFDKIKNEFFDSKPSFRNISMGMSGDYLLAVDKGATMIRVGSIIFQ